LVKWVIFSIKTAQKKMRFPYLESLYGLQQIASFVRNHQLFLGDVCPEPVLEKLNKLNIKLSKMPFFAVERALGSVS
jgi:hypothetical protein